MLFLREIIAFGQLIILPGLVLCGIMKTDFGKFRTLLLVPGISLIINYLAVFSAWHAGIFNRRFSWIYTVVTIILLIAVYRRKIPDFFAAGFKFDVRIPVSFFSGRKKLSDILIYAGAVCGIFYCLIWFFNGFDNVFTCWDSALSWNFWAESWADGIYPSRISFYPQLLPMNWALGYHLAGNSGVFAAKSTVSVFPLLTVLFLADHGICRKKKPFLLAIPVYCFYMMNVDYLSHGGELDLVLSYLSAAIFFTVVYAEEANGEKVFLWRLFTGVLLTAAAGSTKQAGLYMLCALPVMIFFFAGRKFAELHISRKRITLFTLVSLTVIFLSVVPGYYSASKRISVGKDDSNVTLVTQTIYGGKNYVERFICSTKQFMLRFQAGIKHVPSARHAEIDKNAGFFMRMIKLYKRHLPLGLFMLIVNGVIIFQCFKRRELKILQFLFIPFFLIWSIFFCYDLRNLSIIVPFFAVFTANGIYEFFQTEKGRKIAAASKWKLCFAVFMVFSIMYPEFYSDDVRSQKVREKRFLAGIPEVNSQLMLWRDTEENAGMIITDYEYLKLMPEFRDNYISLDMSLDDENIFNDYVRMLESSSVTAVLLPDHAMKKIADDLKEREKSGKMRKVFSAAEYTFYKKCR